MMINLIKSSVLFNCILIITGCDWIPNSFFDGLVELGTQPSAWKCDELCRSQKFSLASIAVYYRLHDQMCMCNLGWVNKGLKVPFEGQYSTKILCGIKFNKLAFYPGETLNIRAVSAMNLAGVTESNIFITEDTNQDIFSSSDGISIRNVDSIKAKKMYALHKSEKTGQYNSVTQTSASNYGSMLFAKAKINDIHNKTLWLINTEMLVDDSLFVSATSLTVASLPRTCELVRSVSYTLLDANSQVQVLISLNTSPDCNSDLANVSLQLYATGNLLLVNAYDNNTDTNLAPGYLSLGEKHQIFKYDKFYVDSSVNWILTYNITEIRTRTLILMDAQRTKFLREYNESRHETSYLHIDFTPAERYLTMVNFGGSPPITKKLDVYALQGQTSKALIACSHSVVKGKHICGRFQNGQVVLEKAVTSQLSGAIDGVVYGAGMHGQILKNGFYSNYEHNPDWSNRQRPSKFNWSKKQIIIGDQILNYEIKEKGVTTNDDKLVVKFN